MVMNMQVSSMILSGGGVEVMTPEGEILQGDYGWARDYLRSLSAPPVLVHAKSLFAKLGVQDIEHAELLELFAFVYPARFCVPTVVGLRKVLGLDLGGGVSSVPLIVSELLEELSEKRDHFAVFWSLAHAMQSGGWLWSEDVLVALRGNSLGESVEVIENPYAVWEFLPKWQEHPPRSPAGDDSVSEQESAARLDALLGGGAEVRQGQRDYCASVTRAFTPRRHESVPNLVLAEGGTGIGKTYGYLSPALLWSEKNESSVWISTYTRNLQHQIIGALLGCGSAVIRKGRENYLCLRNFAHLAERARLQKRLSVAMGLMALWSLHSRDGDLNGGDFPSWLGDIYGRHHTSELADKRGECTYSACPHYRNCFIEHSVRRAKDADIVVANHALVIENLRQRLRMEEKSQADTSMPLRYIFDEGHRLFDSADGAFAWELSGWAMADLRRWFAGRGSDSGDKSGLGARLHGLLPNSDMLAAEVLNNLECLPIIGGQQTIQQLLEQKPESLSESLIDNACAGEAFLRAVFCIVEARAEKGRAGDYYGLEYALPHYDDQASADSDELFGELTTAAGDLADELQILALAVQKLQELLVNALEGLPNSRYEDRNRLRSIVASLQARALEPLTGWLDMLDMLKTPLIAENLKEYDPRLDFCDWLAIHRQQGKITDVGYHRHYIDPMLPFSKTIQKNTHGCIITSATLTDDATTEEGWERAYRRCGAHHLRESAGDNAASAIKHYRFASSFDYAKQARIIVINDVEIFSPPEIAVALTELFAAANGGGLGLFTSIKNLRETHKLLSPKLSKYNIPLYAQHVDAYHLSDLISIFRQEINSCLLGTDALRDGVDIPGQALRLVVFDKIPWQRRSLLLKARVKKFGKGYDTMLARSALRQAFGRLIRSEYDRGVFVILDNRLQQDLHTAFPENVLIQKLNLSEASHLTQQFLQENKDEKPRQA